MQKVELKLENFDARITKIEIKPKNADSKVIMSSKMYDEITDKRVSVKIYFEEVAAIEFRINYFDSMIGVEACGLYCISDQSFVESVVRGNFNRRKEVYLMEGNYNYEKDDEYDLLNTFDVSEEFSNNIEDYKAYIQNVDAGIYVIVAKNIRIER